MNREKVARFQVQRKLKQAWLFYFVFGALTLGGMIAFFFNNTAGWVFGGCFGGIILLMLIDHLAPGSYYLITETGILAKRMFSKQLFQWKEIKYIENIGFEQAADLANQAQQTEAGAVSDINISQAVAERKKLGKLLIYCTIPFMFSESSIGHETNVTKSKTTTKGEFIHLVTREEKHYLLSPKEYRLFIEKANNYLH